MPDENRPPDESRPLDENRPPDEICPLDENRPPDGPDRGPDRGPHRDPAERGGTPERAGRPERAGPQDTPARRQPPARTPQPPTQPVVRASEPAAVTGPPRGWLLRAVRAATALAGLALIAFGVQGLLHDRYITDPADVLWWAAGAVVIHDGLWLPLVCLVGAVLRRGPAARAGLVVAAAVTAVGLPAVLRAGQDHGNPSLLPLPYARNWLLTLAAIALLSAVRTLLLRWHRRR
ncbi:hypothetical protein ACFZB9_23095 [Kitasatospora sp. NPDC008050]|uniref:hypothetical protein n=1 Tax=Kitasatospora sp. NPDC008050 TaxID=3364021 RepID=UPI0036F01260